MEESTIEYVYKYNILLNVKILYLVICSSAGAGLTTGGAAGGVESGRSTGFGLSGCTINRELNCERK